MTTREKAIVSANTGYLMCNMSDMLKYLSEKFGRTISESDLDLRNANCIPRNEYYGKVLPDFIALCEGDAKSTDKASWWC